MKQTVFHFVLCLFLLGGASSSHASRTFTGSTSNYLVRTASVPVSSDEPISMWCWAKPNVTNAYQNLVGVFEDGDVGYFTLELFNDASFQARKANSVATASGSSYSSYSSGSWQGFGAVFNTDTSRTAYYGATAATTDTTSVTDPVGLDAIGVGIFNVTDSPGNAMDGLLAHCAIWAGLLDGADFTALNNGTCPRDVLDDGSAAPVAWWPMTVDDGATVEDNIGTYDLTVTGTVAYSSDNPTVSCGGVPQIFLQTGDM